MQDDVSIDTFVQKQRERHRRIRSEGISWADEITVADRIGSWIDSDWGARVATALIVFSFFALTSLGAAAIQSARGF